MRQTVALTAYQHVVGYYQLDVEFRNHILKYVRWKVWAQFQHTLWVLFLVESLINDCNISKIWSMELLLSFQFFRIGITRSCFSVQENSKGIINCLRIRKRGQHGTSWISISHIPSLNICIFNLFRKSLGSLAYANRTSRQHQVHVVMFDQTFDIYLYLKSAR